MADQVEMVFPVKKENEDLLDKEVNLETRQEEFLALLDSLEKREILDETVYLDDLEYPDLKVKREVPEELVQTAGPGYKGLKEIEGNQGCLVLPVFKDLPVKEVGISMPIFCLDFHKTRYRVE